MAQTWVTVRVDDGFAKDLSLLARLEEDGDRSKLVRRVLEKYCDTHLGPALEKELARLKQEIDSREFG